MVAQLVCCTLCGLVRRIDGRQQEFGRPHIVALDNRFARRNQSIANIPAARLRVCVQETLLFAAQLVLLELVDQGTDLVPIAHDGIGVLGDRVVVHLRRRIPRVVLQTEHYLNAIVIHQLLHAHDHRDRFELAPVDVRDAAVADPHAPEANGGTHRQHAENDDHEGQESRPD